MTTPSRQQRISRALAAPTVWSCAALSLDLLAGKRCMHGMNKVDKWPEYFRQE